MIKERLCAPNTDINQKSENPIFCARSKNTHYI